MRRNHLTVIADGTSVPISHLFGLFEPRVGYVSEYFPLYPITICVCVRDPPFNKLSMSFQEGFQPSLLKVECSKDCWKWRELVRVCPDSNFSNLFKGEIKEQYVKVVMEQPFKSSANLCSVVKIVGMEMVEVVVFPMRFAGELSARMRYKPNEFRLLELLECKIKTSKTPMLKEQVKMEQVLAGTLSEEQIEREIEGLQMASEGDGEVEMKNSDDLQKDIQRLREQLNHNSIQTMGNIRPHALDYFKKYHNVEVRERYLRLLSSEQSNDHQKALLMFWQDSGQLSEWSVATEEAILMFLIYYLQFLQDAHLNNVFKILRLFLTKATHHKAMWDIYQRLLFDLFKLVLTHPDALPLIYRLYDMTPNRMFLQQLLLGFKSKPLRHQLQMIEILEKISFRSVKVEDVSEVCECVGVVLQEKSLKLPEKNRAYNIVAYLAACSGKPTVMKYFEHLNAMILMSMEKIVDDKMKQIHVEKGEENAVVELTREHCQFCGLVDSSFRDDNLFDLHVEKDCKLFNPCVYCSQNIQIPEIFKHRISQCAKKHEFMNCPKCNDTIRTEEESKHSIKCTAKLTTKCPLCLSVLPNKLKLKEHVLVETCPNNPRN